MLNHLELGGYIADTVREPLLVLDARFKVVAANDAYYTSFETTAAETIEVGLFDLGAGQWDSVELRRQLREVLPEHRRIEGFALEFASARRGPRHLMLNACEIVRPDEHEYLILLAIEDVTKRRSAEAALHVRTRELERSNRELEQFAAIASHDLHEPLRKVRTYGNLLLESPTALPTAEGRDHVERMVHAATRMQALINGLLALARVAAPQRLIPVDVAAIVHEVLVDLDAAVAGAGAIVTVGALPAVAGDPTLLRQLFQNLIANALKFRREGVVPSISVEAFVPSGRSESGQLQSGICVRDNGIGFDAHHAEVIFEPLERLHGRTEYPGSGMGLALARRIAERHGGSISAEGTAGEGARFCIALPCGANSSGRLVSALPLAS